MKRLTLVIALLTVSSAHAEIHAASSHFAVGKAGKWDATTTVIDGPQKGKTITSSTCVDANASKEGMQKILALSDAMKSCKMTVTKDTTDAFDSDQVCQYGPVTTHTTNKMKRVSDDSYEMTTTVENNGSMLMRTRTLNQYMGACTPTPVAAAAKNNTQCQECKAQLISTKAQCEQAPAQMKATCLSMVPQMEAACNAGCK